MDELTNEIKEAFRRRLLYAALLLTVTLPDICAALESANGFSTEKLYKGVL
jgi:hypothetical protein